MSVLGSCVYILTGPEWRNTQMPQFTFYPLAPIPGPLAPLALSPGVIVASLGWGETFARMRVTLGRVSNVQSGNG